MEGMPTLLNQIGEDSCAHDFDSRYQVIGRAEVSRAFWGSGHLPYTRTLTGGGRQAKTAVFEVDKKKPEHVECLRAWFESNSIQSPHALPI